MPVMQLMVGIDNASGNIMIVIGQMTIAMTPQDVSNFIAALATKVAEHPQLQPRPASHIVVASALPAIAGGINLDGR
jgi:hypothetical protein